MKTRHLRNLRFRKNVKDETKKNKKTKNFSIKQIAKRKNTKTRKQQLGGDGGAFTIPIGMIVMGVLSGLALICVILHAYGEYKERRRVRRGYNGGSIEQQSSGNTKGKLHIPNITAIVTDTARKLIDYVNPETSRDAAAIKAATQVVKPNAKLDEINSDISEEDAKSLKIINPAIFGLQTLTYLMSPDQKKQLLRVALKKFIKNCPTIDVEEIYYKILFETNTSDKTYNVLSMLDEADELLTNCEKGDFTDLIRKIEDTLGMEGTPNILLRQVKDELKVKDKRPSIFSRYLTISSRPFSGFSSLRNSFTAMSSETLRNLFRNRSNPVIRTATEKVIDDVSKSLGGEDNMKI
jgi:hypothetical protein